MSFSVIIYMVDVDASEYMHLFGYTYEGYIIIIITECLAVAPQLHL